MAGTMLFIKYIRQTKKINMCYHFNCTLYYINLYKVCCSAHAYGSRWSFIIERQSWKYMPQNDLRLFISSKTFCSRYFSIANSSYLRNVDNYTRARFGNS